MEESDPLALTIGVLPVADEPEIAPLSNTRALEDELLPLASIVNFSPSQDRDGSEAHWLIIVDSSLPFGAKLILNSEEMIPVEGLYEVAIADIPGLALLPTPESNEAFTLTLRGKTIDTMEVIDCATGITRSRTDSVVSEDVFLPSKC